MNENVTDIGKKRNQASLELPVDVHEYREALAQLINGLTQQPASTPVDRARVESGKAALRMALRLASNLP